MIECLAEITNTNSELLDVHAAAAAAAAAAVRYWPRFM